MQHPAEMQSAFAVIEAHLLEDCSLKAVAREVGLSEYYFHRLFLAESGKTFGEYVQKRRLALGASMLANSEISLLDLAILLQFSSQEAFTRAFKKTYQLPPGKYRQLLQNVWTGEKKMANETEITGWLFTGTASDKYRYYLDKRIFNTGSQAVTMKAVATTYVVDDYAVVMQQFQATNYRNQRVRFAGMVKTEDADYAGLWLRFDDGQGGMLKIDNMSDRPITGTNDWNQYACVMDVPKEAALINIGILLQGNGQVWLDDTSFDIVTLDMPTTNFKIEATFAEEHANLDFED